MSTETTHDSWFGRKLGRNRFQAIGVGVLLSGALVLGACGDGDEDEDATPTTGAGSTVTTTVPTTESSPTMGTNPTMTTPDTDQTPTTGTPGTGTPGTGGDDILSVFEAEFSTAPWFSAVDDVDLTDGEVLVTVNDEAATLTEAEVEEMCNDVSEVVFSDAVGAIEEVDSLRVEDMMGTEVATADSAGECTVA